MKPLPAELSTHPRRVTLVSPVTGKLAVYDQVRVLETALPNSSVDSTAMLNSINNQWYNEGIDGYCSDVRHYVSEIADFVEVETYLPAEQLNPVAGAGMGRLFVIPAIIVKAIAIVLAIVTAAVAVVGIMAAIAHFWPAYPKNFYAINPETGNAELMTREQAVTANQITYPGMYVDPNTAAVFDPSNPGFSSFINWYDSNIPSDWNEPTTYPTDINGIIIAIVAGVGAISAIYLGVKYLGPYLAKKT